ncbi:MAG TPA: OmpA family protein [Sandaracinaceae bacterium LLY-WYZ-13_1]|nr:OmpA family protein [Sandaracinaceae bacterium LLY-WYZ-13_1]
MRIRTQLTALSTLVLLTGSIVGCGGRDWETDYAQLQSEHEQTLAELSQTRERLEELQGQNDELRELMESQGRDLSDMQALREQLQRELDAARERERQQQERLSSLRNMARQFRDMVAAGQLRVRIVRGNMVVELPENVLFDSGRAELREAANETLARVAEVLSSVPNRNFLVAGHTDNVPVGRRRRYDSNWELSAARGVAVVRFFIEQGMSADRLAAAGYADTQPVASNATEEGRAQNRRIEIIVLPNLDELPDLSGLESDLSSGGDES